MDEQEKGPPKAPRLSAAKPQDIKQFNTWCINAKRGQWCLYWTGYLQWDRENTPFTDAQAKRREWAERFGTIAWGHYAAGRVILVQRRVGHGKYEYFAVRR